MTARRPEEGVVGSYKVERMSTGVTTVFCASILVVIGELLVCQFEDEVEGSRGRRQEMGSVWQRSGRRP